MGYLGTEQYGVWLTLSSLLTWLSISDFGFGGNALINVLAEAAGRDDRDWQKQLTATAFWSLAAIAACLGLFVACIGWFVPWARVFNISSAVAAKEVEAALAISCAAFLLEFPTRVFVGVYHGNQEGYVANVWSILGSVLSLIALLSVTRRAGGLPELALALWGTRLAVSAAAAIHLFFWRSPWLAPAPGAVSRRAFQRLAALGARYVVVQFGAIGMQQSQPLVIAQIVGPAAVPVFSITQRLAVLPQTFISMFLNPLMPAYAEARARGDWSWIRRTYRRTVALATLASVVSAVSVFFLLRPVARLWVGAALQPPVSLVAAFSVYVLVAGFASAASVMLYGLERVGRQAIIAVANACAVVALGTIGTLLWGLPGMGAATAVAFLITSVPGQLLEARAALEEHPS